MDDAMTCDGEGCEQEAVTVLVFEFPKKMVGVYCGECADYLSLIGPKEVKSTNPLVLEIRLEPRHMQVVTSDVRD